jgi:hypothetical protein
MWIELTRNSFLDLVHLSDVHDGVKHAVKLIFELGVR